MIKSYLKSIVRDGRGKYGIGVELFRLEAAESELTEGELEAIEEDVSDVEKSSTAIMRIYEEIGEDFWTGDGMTVKKFSNSLNELGSSIKRLNVHINSLGGDTFTAQAIHSLISDYPAKTTSYIDGVSASAATIIMSGANEVIARHNTSIMIHAPWSVVMGNAEDLRDAAENLDKITIPIISVYKEQVKGKIDEAKIRSLMEEETWMTADEALEYGFVDKVRGKISAITRVNAGKIMCSGKIMNIGRYQYKNVPKFKLRVEPEGPEDTPAAPPPANKPKETKKEHKMTLEELQQADPDLVASMYADAGRRERERLNALNAMMAPGLEAIIAKAIEDSASPASIAMECFAIMKDTAANVTQVNALKRDAAPASQVPAADAPYKPPGGEQKKEKKAISAIANAFKSRPEQTARAKANGRTMLN